MPSSAESVSKPVVFESPKSAVAVSPVPVVELEVSLSLFLVLDSLEFPEPESEGIETDGIDGEEISGIEIEGILVCAKIFFPPVFAIRTTNKRAINFLVVLQV